MVSARSRVVALLILGAALVFLLVRLLPFAADALIPRRSQAENLRLAREFIAAHDSQLHADPRFRKVRLDAGTVRGGCIVVIGSVASPSDSQDLRRMLLAKKPPVELWYQVDVGSPQP